MIFDIHSDLDTDAVEAYLERRILAKRPLRVGITTGVFDMTHAYHILYLKRCRGQCDLLVVGVDADHLVRADKGPSRPIMNEQLRSLAVDSLKPVDLTFILNNLDDLTLAGYLFRRAEVLLFKNQEFEGASAPEKVIGLEHGARLVIVPDLEVLTSTTEIIEHLKRTNEGTQNG
jgi:D-beta-D-heptose 7-phosphate kinase/D-beta-D-heptose 1-phosphate adenosyltransferase